MSIRVQITPVCTCGTLLGNKSDLYNSLIEEAIRSGFENPKHVEGHVLDILPLAYAVSQIGIDAYKMYFMPPKGGIYSITMDLLELGYAQALQHLFDILSRDVQ